MQPKDLHGYIEGLERMEQLAREFGLAPEVTARIVQAVHVKAEASPTWGSAEERLQDIRNRIHLARG